MVPLDFLEEDLTWVACNLSTESVLRAETIELMNWLNCFGCSSEEFRFVVTNMFDLMANSFPPLDAYRDRMACCLVAMELFQPQMGQLT